MSGTTVKQPIVSRVGICSSHVGTRLPGREQILLGGRLETLELRATFSSMPLRATYLTLTEVWSWATKLLLPVYVGVVVVRPYLRGVVIVMLLVLAMILIGVLMLVLHQIRRNREDGLSHRRGSLQLGFMM